MQAKWTSGHSDIRTALVPETKLKRQFGEKPIAYFIGHALIIIVMIVTVVKEKVNLHL
jgi:hypothetical protein